MEDAGPTSVALFLFLVEGLAQAVELWVAALGLSVFRMSDQSELPVLRSLPEMRVEPGGTASSAPVQFCLPALGSAAGGFSPPGTNLT